MAQLTADDLIEPNGPIEIGLFLGEVNDSIALGARVTAYLAQAYVDSRVVAAAADTNVQNRKAKAFVLYTAYMAAYRLMLRSPLTVNVNEKGSHGYSTKQIDAMKQLADDQLEIVEEPIDQPVPDEAIAKPISVPTEVCWI